MSAELPEALKEQIRAVILMADDPQSLANDLLTISIGACVALSLGSLDDARSIYKDTIRALNVIVQRARQRNPPS